MGLDKEFTPESMIGMMCKNERNWTLIEEYIVRVLKARDSVNSRRWNSCHSGMYSNVVNSKVSRVVLYLMPL